MSQQETGSTRSSRRNSDLLTSSLLFYDQEDVRGMLLEGLRHDLLHSALSRYDLWSELLP